MRRVSSKLTNDYPKPKLTHLRDQLELMSSSSGLAGVKLYHMRNLLQADSDVDVDSGLNGLLSRIGTWITQANNVKVTTAKVAPCLWNSFLT